MIKRIELDAYLGELFGEQLLEEARRADPYLANSGQLLQRDNVEKVVLGVSLTEDFLKEAVRIHADTVIVHHGLKIEAPYQILLPFHLKRLRLIVENKLNVYGYHGALDKHPVIGNNAVIARELGGKIVEPYFDGWGWAVDLPNEISQDKLAKQLSDLTSHDVFAVYSNKQMVKRLGVVSGAGIPKEPQFLEMLEKGVEVHITGEVSEGTVHRIKEMGITYLAAGHYATEVFGVQELGKKIKEEFKDRIEVEFIDIPNPI